MSKAMRSVGAPAPASMFTTKLWREPDVRVMSVLRAAARRTRRPVPGPTSLDPVCWAAGGALRDHAAGLPFKDIDLFFASREAARACEVALLADAEMQASLVERVVVPHSWKGEVGVVRVDTSVGRVELVIGEWFQDPRNILRTFDFRACCAAVDVDGNMTSLRSFHQDVKDRRLVLNSLTTPLSTLMRAHRFMQRGWDIEVVQYHHLMRRAVESPEADGWTEVYGGTRGPPKGVPFWAEAAWLALRGTSDAAKMAAVVRRAADDPEWAAVLETTAQLMEANRLTGLRAPGFDKSKHRETKKTALNGLRAFIVESIEEERHEWS